MLLFSGTNTGIVPNGIATAGSMGTDMYGMAILNACEQLNERLQPYRETFPLDEGTEEYDGEVWKSLVTKAFFDRVNLSAQGFYTVPTDRCGYNWNEPDITKRGHPFNYFTQGAACTEVEVDCLTGDHRSITFHPLFHFFISFHLIFLSLSLPFPSQNHSIRYCDGCWSKYQSCNRYWSN